MARPRPHLPKGSILAVAGIFCLVTIASGILAEESAELAEPVDLGESHPFPDTTTRDASPTNARVEFLDPEAVPTSAQAANVPQPAADTKAAGTEAPGEKKSEAEKKPEEQKPGDKAEAGDGKASAEVIPPPPEPTAEELTKRREHAADFQSLGEKFFGFPVTGSLYTRYRFREGAGFQDQDIYEFLSMDLGEKNRQAITGHFDARVANDLNGRHTGAKADVFSGLVDTYQGPADAMLYSAYADFNRIPGVDFLRAGRQFNYDTTEVVQFDGLRLDTKPWFAEHETVFSFYGGLPVHQDEHSQRGDDLAGTAVEGKPWNSMRMRLDYIHVDDNLSGETSNSQEVSSLGQNTGAGNQHNDLLALSLWQTFQKPDVRVQGRFSTLDGEPREGLARVFYNKPDDKLQVSATYQAWFELQGRLATEF
ncbi:MAG: hypothetical protein ABSE73_03230, partial [Planctomycetota bacterium]